MTDILIVDDERDIRELISDILEDEGYTTRKAGTSDEAMAAVTSQPPALMILDIWLKDSAMDGIDILKAVKRDYPEVPVVIISGHGNIEIAVAAIKQGAYDFIEKPFNIDQLMVVIARAMETSRLRRENVELKRKGTGPVDMIGASAAFKSLKSNLEKVMRSNGRVLLTGPAGSGKELAARTIHAGSDRSGAPFVIVNSAAVEPDHMEEVLFGRESPERGIEEGLLEQANGGVIYFDEVADMPPGTQSKILRVLVEQSFTRVGGSDKIQVDVRVISSTTRNLQAEIEAKRFREELYHRLNVVPIHVPPLADRREDIPMLVQTFMKQISEHTGIRPKFIGDDAMAVLQAHDWPGNIRQLRNNIERLMILTRDEPDDTVIGVEKLPSEIGENLPRAPTSDDAHIMALPLREARERFERDYLLAQISRFGGNISRTAEFVGMERSALHRKLKSLGV